MLEFTICFVACHAGPADHFAAFANELQARGGKVEIFASGPALSKLPQAQPFSLEGRIEWEVASEIARKCAKAAIVITDVGHPFNISMQKALAQEAPHMIRAAYYDNPEDFVPGGYSETAAKVMQAAEKVFFANAHLANLPLLEEPLKEVALARDKKIGLGYYPVEQAESIAKLRKEKGMQIRAELFKAHGLVDRGQKLLVYAGGNNEEYFTKAWPAFLQIFKKAALDDVIVILQQHPGAKKENRDGKLAEERGANLWISHLSSPDVQAAADAMLYYQTSMAPQFVLAQIPTIQVGHEVYQDILTKNKLCRSATNPEEFLSALKELQTQSSAPTECIKESLGIHPDWGSRLAKRALELIAEKGYDSSQSGG